MELLKKYSAMFLPIGIILAAAGLIVAAILMGGTLKKQMAASAKQYAAINILAKKAVSQKQWEVEKEYQDAHQKDADAFAAMAANSSQRELISYNMFPSPDVNETSNTIFHNFAKAYSKDIDALLLRMKARPPYTATEMQMATRSAGPTATGVPEAKTLTDALCMQRAKDMMVYASPRVFAGYDYGSTLSPSGRDKALMECWYWQTAYWIQTDIVETILVANKGAKNVLDAPVKRLLGVSFASPDSTALTRTGLIGTGVTGFTPMAPPPPSAFGTTGTSITLDAELPSYVQPVQPGQANQSVQTGMAAFIAASPTGRTSNTDIDVVYFSFAVVIRASELMPFIKQLCSEKTHQFKGFDGKAAPQTWTHNGITILSCSVGPVDLPADEMLYYRYGDDALYKVNFVCEYIFDRGGYDAIKPAVVKNPPTAAAPGTGG
jgi:hypothetical protein